MSQFISNSVSTSTNNVCFSVSEKNDNLYDNTNMRMKMATRYQSKTRKYSEQEMEVAEFLVNMAEGGRFNSRTKNTKDYSIYFEDICPETEKILAKQEQDDEDYVPISDDNDEQEDLVQSFEARNEKTTRVEQDDGDEDYVPQDDDNEEDDDVMFFENVYIHEHSKYYNMKMKFEDERDEDYNPDTDSDFIDEDDDALYFENVYYDPVEAKKENECSGIDYMFWNNYAKNLEKGTYVNDEYEDSDESSDYEYHSEDDTEHEYDYSGDEDDAEFESETTVIQDRARTYSVEHDYDSSSDYVPSDDE
jgi:hypothetical protein